MGKVWRKFKSLSRGKKVLVVTAMVLLIFMVTGAAGYYYLMNKPRESVKIDENGDVVVVPAPPLDQLDGTINILLLGVDERKNSKEKVYRTDTIILASIDPKTERISMLSIPRDTRVKIPKVGMDKINAASAYGGLNMTVAVVQQLTGIEIHGYVKTDFNGFKDIIDTLGGVTINVEKNMRYQTGDKEDGVINLKKGEQVLDGSKALQYVRFRHDAFGDITRTARQQVLLKAVAKKLMDPSSITKIPTLIPQFMSAVETNLPPSDLLKIAKVAVKYDSSKVISQTLPGYFLNLDGISYWGVNEEDVKKVAYEVLVNGNVIGNTPDKLIQVSTDASNQNTNKPPEEPKPQIKMGELTVVAKGTYSVTLSASPSTGIAKAEVWRTGLATPVDSWTGSKISTRVQVEDKTVQPGKEYSYVLKGFDDKGNLLLTTNPVMVTTIEEIQPPKVSGVEDGKIYNKPVTPVFTEGTATLDGKEFESGQKVSDNGEHVLTVSNGTLSTTIKFTIDTKPPVIDITSNVPPVTSEKSIQISGTVEPGSTVAASTTGVKKEYKSTDGTFSFVIEFPNPGTYTVTITATDLAGNPASPKTFQITYTPTPTQPLTQP